MTTTATAIPSTATATPSRTMPDPPLRPPGADSDTGVEPRRLVRVMLVDDHPAVRAGVEGVLEDERHIMLVASLATAREALAAADTAAVDVAIVDYELGGQNGLTLARALSKRPRAPRVLIYTAYADVKMALAAIVAGADGLLSKASFGDELRHAIRMLARGRRHFPAISRPSAEGVLAQLELRDQAIVGMLIHGLDAQNITQTLRISEAELDARRWAVLQTLTAPPPTSDPGLPRRRHAVLDYDRPLRHRAVTAQEDEW
jgi:DNA-binding NarL/FixJ family response regulator